LSDKILYADDEKNYCRMIKMFLESEDYSVITASDGMQVLELFNLHKDIKLIILDVMMPKLDGWKTCREIRKKSDVPILMLTALDNADNEVFGMENGADDYIAKPFTHKILIARIKALLRRSHKNKLNRFKDEGMAFDETANSIYMNGNIISLTPKEYELLKCLVLNKNLVLSRNKLLDKVWGYDYFGDPRTVDTHIKSLRAKLGPAGSQIFTLRNKGHCYKGVQN